jgi:hypothetical protein
MAAKQLENIWVDKFKLYCKEEALAALAALADLWPAAGLLDSEVVRRHRMLRDYRAHCAGQGATPASLARMQAVILLSQLLARPAAQAVDLPATVKHPQKKWPRRGVMMHREVPCYTLNIYTLPASITIHPPPSTAGAVPSLP